MGSMIKGPNGRQDPFENMEWPTPEAYTKEEQEQFDAEFNKLMYEGRTDVTPGTPWSHLQPELSPEAIEQLHRISAEDYKRRSTCDYGPVVFTCAFCGVAPRCCVAFDMYNTYGDCLMDK